METFLLIALIAIAFIRWMSTRQKLAEMSSRIDALARLVVQTQARVHAAAPLAHTAPPPQTQPIAPVIPTPVAAPPQLAPTPWLASEILTSESVPAPQPVPAAPVIPVVIVPEPTPAEIPTPQPARITPEHRVPPPPAFTAPRAPRRTTADWEALVGGNLMNKVGVLALVIGIVFLLGYAFTQTGPLGRVAMSIGVSLAMLISGAVFEKRETYRTFAQGLLGGGWAALYFTVYAMQSLDSAKVIDNPVIGAILLLAVATGMIVHSLRYRSQTVTGLAYFIAFVTLAITRVTPLSVVAVVPLAASLLYIAHRFQWRNFALFGLVATYAICASRPDTGAPLWQAQAIFATYWILFEAFDLLSPHEALLPLNALGFLSLSLVKWHRDAPDEIWQLLAATAAAYLVGAILRARSGKWHPAITLTAALAAAAIFLKLDHQWVALALLIEGELFYLAGLRLRESYLRYLGGGLFTIELSHLIVKTVPDTAVPSWTPVAIANVVVFYANRALRSTDTFYGYAAAAMMALVAGFNAPHGDRGLAWMLLAAAPFFIGWRWRLPDFRIQAYALGAIGPIGMAVAWPEPPLSIGIGAALAYAGTLCALRSEADRFAPDEQDAVRATGSLFVTGLLTALVWLIVPREYLGLGWMALAVILLELGMRRLPVEFRRQAYVLAAAGAVVVLYLNLIPIQNTSPLRIRAIPAVAALLAYAMAARARNEERGQVLRFASFIAAGFLLTGLWALLPPVAVGPAWAVVALVLAEFALPDLTFQAHLVSLAAFARLFFANFNDDQHAITALTVLPVLLSHYYLWSRTSQRFYLYTAGILAAALTRFDTDRVFTATGWAVLMVVFLFAGKRWKIRDLCWQSYVLAAMAFARCWAANFYSPNMFAGIAGPVFIGATVIGCLYAAQLLSDLDTRPRLYLSLLASSLLAVLLYFQVSGNLLTLAWGIEGIALMAAGFPLRDRVLRLSGMALLLSCILKLFLWDLRHLETLPRIVSLIGFGLILLAVSWVYARFKDVLVGPAAASIADTKPNEEPV